MSPNSRTTVFIQANDKQALGAQVAKHALLRHGKGSAEFDVKIVHVDEFPFLVAHEGRQYLRDGADAAWRNDDLQSFAPLRFAIPERMGYQGRALVIDPDIFAIRDIGDLLTRDMGGAAVLARPADAENRPGSTRHFASSVMLLDCARLRHWRLEEDFESLFRFERDYRQWMWLRLEPAGSVAAFETVWNDFDRLGPDTRLLHNTNRRTQPWKTGLPADFETHGASIGAKLKTRFKRLKSSLLNDHAPNGYYKPHPDPAQERFFFSLLAECLDQGKVSTAFLDAEIGRGHIRPDAPELVEKARAQPFRIAA